MLGSRAYGLARTLTAPSSASSRFPRCEQHTARKPAPVFSADFEAPCYEDTSGMPMAKKDLPQSVKSLDMASTKTSFGPRGPPGGACESGIVSVGPHLYFKDTEQITGFSGVPEAIQLCRRPEKSHNTPRMSGVLLELRLYKTWADRSTNQKHKCPGGAGRVTGMVS
ncbi:uncharacterized protein B0I36DRAFT_20677 [Microdochium trichocladiopsis]|uniref:Uncharacterized protein n=1 Tax=Microdochium trichocladiopsis TaxID=1682393 RepID=A0A9P8YKL8_9PEZI|nr:uncharacterized protein B0I36DRAFT_20677 [Microdochium trichocladiopsis]KAH7041221.1 hypothetical protein B0I36DRAFT_20677 [Microdochium trichocladiopsis]